MADEPNQHGRRETDVERRRWSDDRIEERFNAVANEMSALRGLPLEVAKTQLRVDGLSTELAGIKDTLSDFLDEYRQDRDDARKGRGAIVASAIGAFGLVLVAVIGAIVQLIASAPT